MSAPVTSSIHKVDVFSSGRGTGNPLAVMIDAGHLDDARMQAIAAWNNLAETTFLLAPTQAGADYRVRIFTPEREIAFAGHPSIGSAHVARRIGLVDRASAKHIQECPAGLLPIQVDRDGEAELLLVRVPRSRVVKPAPADDGGVDQALGSARRGVLPPTLVEGGRRWWLAELASEDEVRRFEPDREAIRRLAARSQSLGLCIFARSGGAGYDLVVRAFPLGVGIDEDPASGAANAAIAAFLDESGALGALGNAYRVSQGQEMGRDARLLLRLDGDRQVWVGGSCETVIEGSFHW